MQREYSNQCKTKASLPARGGTKKQNDMEKPTIESYVSDPEARKVLNDFMAAQESRQQKDNEAEEQHRAAMTDEERTRYDALMRKAAEDIAAGLERESSEFYSKAIKEKLAAVSDGLSLAYIAKEYFGKSKEWLYQRLNGSVVNGKQAGFKREEVVQLQLAIRDFGNKLSTVTLI